MVTILPQEESVGSMIGRGLGAGLGKSLAQQLQQHSESKKIKGMQSKWTKDTTPMEMFRDISALPISSEAKKMQLGVVTKDLMEEKLQFQRNKEIRLQRSELSEQYNRIVKDLQENLKSGVIIDRKGTGKAITALRKEQHENLKKIGMDEPLSTEAIENYFKEFGGPPPAEEQKGIFSRMGDWFKGGKDPFQFQELEEKITFDKNNEDHIKIREEALRVSKGDKAKANKLLAKMFTDA